jgi:hypothetical protein
LRERRRSRMPSASSSEIVIALVKYPDGRLDVIGPNQLFACYGLLEQAKDVLRRKADQADQSPIVLATGAVPRND